MSNALILNWALVVTSVTQKSTSPLLCELCLLSANLAKLPFGWISSRNAKASSSLMKETVAPPSIVMLNSDEPRFTVKNMLGIGVMEEQVKIG